MTKSVKINNVTYSDVPSINIPLATGSGNASFFEVSDTMATASDVASGKYFYTARGVKTEGTNSGGGGGGATNIVQGTFTTGSTGNTTGTFSINYTGSGYPICLVIYVNGGPYNNGTGGDTTWYNSVVRYDVGFYSMVKSRTTTTPTYGTSGADNYGTVTIIYKNSTSTATTYTRTSSMTANTFSSSNAQASTRCVRFKGNGKTVSYYIGNGGSGSIGFAKSTEFAYIAVYSS